MDKNCNHHTKKSLLLAVFSSVAGAALLTSANFESAANGYQAAETLCKLQFSENAHRHNINQTSATKIDVSHDNSVCRVTAKTNEGKVTTFEYPVLPQVQFTNLTLQ